MSQVIKFLSMFTQLLRSVVSFLVIIFFIYMTLAVFSQVLGRYLFNYSIAWATESATFSQIWMIFLASGIAMKEKLHVAIDTLFDVIPVFLQKLLILVIMSSSLFFLYMTIDGSFQLLKIGQIQTSPVLDMKMWIPYLALPVGLSYFSFELLVHYLKMLFLDNADDKEETL